MQRNSLDLNPTNESLNTKFEKLSPISKTEANLNYDGILERRSTKKMISLLIKHVGNTEARNIIGSKNFGTSYLNDSQRLVYHCKSKYKKKILATIKRSDKMQEEIRNNQELTDAFENFEKNIDNEFWKLSDIIKEKSNKVTYTDEMLSFKNFQIDQVVRRILNILKQNYAFNKIETEIKKYQNISRGHLSYFLKRRIQQNPLSLYYFPPRHLNPLLKLIEKLEWFNASPESEKYILGKQLQELISKFAQDDSIPVRQVNQIQKESVNVTEKTDTTQVKNESDTEPEDEGNTTEEEADERAGPDPEVMYSTTALNDQTYKRPHSATLFQLPAKYQRTADPSQKPIEPGNEAISNLLNIWNQLRDIPVAQQHKSNVISCLLGNKGKR